MLNEWYPTSDVLLMILTQIMKCRTRNCKVKVSKDIQSNVGLGGRKVCHWLLVRSPVLSNRCLQHINNYNITMEVVSGGESRKLHMPSNYIFPFGFKRRFPNIRSTNLKKEASVLQYPNYGGARGHLPNLSFQLCPPACMRASSILHGCSLTQLPGTPCPSLPKEHTQDEARRPPSTVAARGGGGAGAPSLSQLLD